MEKNTVRKILFTANQQVAIQLSCCSVESSLGSDVAKCAVQLGAMPWCGSELFFKPDTAPHCLYYKRVFQAIFSV